MSIKNGDKKGDKKWRYNMAIKNGNKMAKKDEKMAIKMAKKGR